MGGWVGAWQGLFDVQHEVLWGVEAVGLPSGELDLVVDAFQLAGADGVVAVVEDAILEEPQPWDEPAHHRVVDFGGEPAPLIQCLLRPAPYAVPVDRPELVLEGLDGAY